MYSNINTSGNLENENTISSFPNFNDWQDSTHSFDEVSTVSSIVVCEFRSKIECRLSALALEYRVSECR